MDPPYSLQQETPVYQHEAVSGRDECPFGHIGDHYFRCQQISAYSWVNIDTDCFAHTFKSLRILPHGYFILSRNELHRRVYLHQDTQ